MVYIKTALYCDVFYLHLPFLWLCENHGGKITIEPISIMPCHMYYLNLRMTKLTLSSEGELSLCEAVEKEEKQFLTSFLNYHLAEIIMLDPLPLPIRRKPGIPEYIKS